MSLTHNKAVTLIELLIALVLLGIMTLAFSSINLFSNYHLRTSQMRSSLHNNLSYTLETITKDVIRATGDKNNPGIIYVSPTSFTVRVDNQTVPTPGNYSGHTIITYALSANTITRQAGAGPTVNLTLQPLIPSGGFTYLLCDTLSCNNTLTSGLGIEIYLTGRYNPTNAVSVDNPQTQMNTKVYSQTMGGQ